MRNDDDDVGWNISVSLGPQAKETIWVLPPSQKVQPQLDTQSTSISPLPHILVIDHILARLERQNSVMYGGGLLEDQIPADSARAERSGGGRARGLGALIAFSGLIFCLFLGSERGDGAQRSLFLSCRHRHRRLRFCDRGVIPDNDALCL